MELRNWPPRYFNTRLANCPLQPHEASIVISRITKNNYKNNQRSLDYGYIFGTFTVLPLAKVADHKGVVFIKGSRLTWYLMDFLAKTKIKKKIINKLSCHFQKTKMLRLPQSWKQQSMLQIAWLRRQWIKITTVCILTVKGFFGTFHTTK